MPEIPILVADVATELDLIKPGWARKVDLRKLKMSDPLKCVLGQIFRSFKRAPQNLRERRAFHFPGTGGCWRREIKKRR